MTAVLWLALWHYSGFSWLTSAAVDTDAGHFESAALLPSARTEAGGTACSGRMYLVGGIGGFAETYDTAFEYDPGTDAWRPMAPLPMLLNHPGVVCARDELYVVGGFGPLGLRLRGFMFARWDPRDVALKYDRVHDRWHTLTPMPEARGAGGIAATHDAIWYGGGIRPNLALASSLFRYDLASGTWSEAPPMPTARDHLRMEAVDGKLYALTGREDDLRFNLATVERFDPAAQTWQTMAPHPVPRGGLGSAVVDGKIYTFGGEFTWHCHPGVEVYDPVRDAWQELGSLPEGRHGIVAGVIDGAVHMVSGGRHPRVSVSRIHRVYQP